MTSRTVKIQDATLKRDIAILSTLAQFHCATVSQLYALCSPDYTITTIRTALFYLAQAHCIAHSTWRVRGLSQEQGHVWVLTAKGHQILRKYLPHLSPQACIELGRPSTALEYEEWRVRIWLRTMLVSFLLHARRTPLLNWLQIQLPWSSTRPVSSKPASPSEPDAVVSVVWHPAERQSNDWLPWFDPTSVSEGGVCYPIFVERMYAQIDIATLLSAGTVTSITSHDIPLVIVRDDVRSAEVYAQMSKSLITSSIRIVSRIALEHTMAQEQAGENPIAREFFPFLPIEAVS